MEEILVWYSSPFNLLIGGIKDADFDNGGK